MIKPKLLLDENIGSLTAEALRALGYNVKSVLEDSAGIDDLSVLNYARGEHRILVTLDRDFGKLIFLQFHKHAGVIFLRLTKDTPENIVTALQLLFKKYGREIRGRFVTISEDNIRIR